MCPWLRWVSFTSPPTTVACWAGPGAPCPERRSLLPPLPGILPVTPRVVSTLDPAEFCARLTDPSQPVNVPRIVFAELTLGHLATDIESADVGNLPYPGLQHLRECLRELFRKPGKPTKVTVRNVRDDVLYRTITGGLYVGQARELKFYPLPSATELDSAHHEWWRSAQAAYGS